MRIGHGSQTASLLAVSICPCTIYHLYGIENMHPCRQQIRNKKLLFSFSSYLTVESSTLIVPAWTGLSMIEDEKTGILCGAWSL